METALLNSKYDKNSIDFAVKELRNGAVGIFPTDTVYGIGCNALNIKALKSLYSIKQRPLDKPINILVSNIDMVNKFVKCINPIEQKLMEEFWPGALTIIFDKSDIVPDLLTAGLDTIGIRMPNNNICLDLIDKFGFPLATSSANIADEPPALSLIDCLTDFSAKVSFILDGGKINNGIPSTIVRVNGNNINLIRQGSVSINDINKCLGGNIKC